MQELMLTNCNAEAVAAGTNWKTVQQAPTTLEHLHEAPNGFLTQTLTEEFT
jgi:hypothetical protein